MLATEINFNGSICGDEGLGYYILGDDYYLLCEQNFVNSFYTNQTEGDVNNIIYTEYVPPNKYPQTIFDVFLLREMNVSPEAIRTDLVNEINNKITNYTKLLDEQEGVEVNYLKENNSNDLDQTNNEDLIIKTNKTDSEEKHQYINYTSSTNLSTQNNISTSSNNTNFITEKTDDEEQVNDSFNSDSKEDLYNSQSQKNPYEQQKQDKNSFISYLLYVATGLFILLSIYIIIHIFQSKDVKTKELEILKKYVLMMRTKGMSDEQIEIYFKNKGYEDKIIKEAFKTLDTKP